jgi:hypothetical protein
MVGSGRGVCLLCLGLVVGGCVGVGARRLLLACLIS